MASIRSFIALPSPVELKTVLGGLQQRLMAEKADVKWDSPDKFHITLKFLGNADPGRLDELSESLSAVASGIGAFSLIYSSLGAFPDLVHPRVVWAGAELCEPLSQLQRQVETHCRRLGFQEETRTFHPHITLGRVKGTTNLGRLTAKLKSITFEPLQTNCRDILLIKSDLRPAGSVYTTLKSFPLNA
ncbi:MAG TPA: RNA 2',3'-cyclic phosphodiesterase [Bacteroidota bacterium]